MARVFRFGDGVSTDAIMPGRYNLTTDPAALARACFVEHRPGFADAVRPGDLIVAGSNFGCGSSREHAPLAIKAAGIGAVVARSFARIFYRNAVNLGLPVIRCPELYQAVEDGDQVEVDILRGNIRAHGRAYQGEPPSAVARRISEAGSLVELIRTGGWAAIEEVI
ncbi:MAG TPA: 3-isopropylmalate dehydratase small subunit [Candidatus Binatia bacterium]|nr:3-isopropylmalate dehydratase small subunit [Candidatus Binatia bacterium]